MKRKYTDLSREIVTPLSGAGKQMIRIKLGELIIDFPMKFSKALVDGKFKKVVGNLDSTVRVHTLQRLFKEELEERIGHKGIRYV